MYINDRFYFDVWGWNLFFIQFSRRTCFDQFAWLLYPDRILLSFFAVIILLDSFNLFLVFLRYIYCIFRLNKDCPEISFKNIIWKMYIRILFLISVGSVVVDREESTNKSVKSMLNSSFLFSLIISSTWS